MEFYPKDKNPMLDERTARFHGRVLKDDLATLPFVLNTCNRDIKCGPSDKLCDLGP